MAALRLLASSIWLAAVVTSQSSPFNPCPVRCSKAGRNPSAWTYLHGEPALNRCNQTTLFDLNLHTPIDDPNTHVTLRSCTATETDTTQEIEYDPKPFIFGEPEQRRRDVGASKSGSAPGCIPGAVTHVNTTKADFFHWDAGAEPSTGIGDVAEAASKLEAYIAADQDCHPTVIFARSGNAVVGLYIGAEIHKPSAARLVQKFIGAAKAISGRSPGRLASQICRDKTPSTWTMGIYADLRGDISAAQDVVRGWSVGECLESIDRQEEWDDFEIEMVQATDIPVDLKLVTGNERKSKRSLYRFDRRAECQAIEVVANDGCISLAQRCNISRTQLENYNKGIPDFCDNLKPGQHVCCSTGTLPDFSPKPNFDGTCAAITIEPTSLCWDIGERYKLKQPYNVTINDFNKNTWGWTGCNNLQLGQRICISTGHPPMPAPIANAVCGPQVPNTPRPANGTELASLNPCPLNVCCNVWGQCGTTKDFCTISPADTGAPGTSKPGANGCVSSCGMEITNNDSPPATFGHIAYFEAWNKKRKCLHMDVTDIDKEKYTHIHFAFGDITPDFQVDVSKVQDQFDKMKGMSGIKRILSFGGWAFSTEAPTYTIFRNGVTAANRATFATNVVNFINQHGLEGVDFDWEYPAAPDLPDIPPGIVQEGKDYLEFLKLIKRRLPNKSVSIAAPASYWYLKGYPIKEIGNVVDYMVYMTYDLHGQWDYGNKWSNPGCPEGNCLRSHINITETENALAMVTKAGVPAKKVYVGIASYGRSFRMEEEGCKGVMCRFTGTPKKSDAEPGRCTNEPGYIASAEIREIIFRGQDPEFTGYTVEQYHDHPSNSDIVVYNGVEWVAWMTDTTKSTRINWVKSLNFGGVSDWAVDLDRDYGDSDVGGVDPDQEEGSLCDFSVEYNDLDALEKAAGSIHSGCLPIHTLRVLKKMLRSAIEKYHSVNNGYDDKFNSYRKYMNKALPALLDDWAYWRDYQGRIGDGIKYFDCKFDGNGNQYEGRCPVPSDVFGGRFIGYWDLELTLRDEDGFYKALAEQGISRDWIEFRNARDEIRCQPTQQPAPCLDYRLDIVGQPKMKPDFEMPNPKDIVEEVMKTLDTLEDQLTIAIFEIGMGTWRGSVQDAVEVLSMPVFLLTQAVEAMDNAKQVGEDIEEEENKNLILTIISAVLFFVPIIGQYSAAIAGMVGLARLFAAVGAGGGLALTIVDIVENPESAPMAIAGMLLGGRIKSPKDFTDAAKVKRGMSNAQREAVGSVFKKHDDSLRRIITTSCRR